MRFLAKDASSALGAERYRSKGHNEEYRRSLLGEQRGHCAYTERVVGHTDTVAIEHFDPRRKGTEDDGYTNHYAVLQHANQRKRAREREHQGANFFVDRWFQIPGEAERRIRYVVGEGVFEATEADDADAEALVAYLGWNEHELFEDRRKHVERLRDLFALAQWGPEEQLAHFSKYPEELHHLSALCAELALDLQPFAAYMGA